VNLVGDTPGASSSYNALLVKYSQRITNGLTVFATYQWSKALDNTSETQAWEVGDKIRDAYNLALDKSVSAHDLPQDFVANAIWDLPVGKGRKYGSNMNKVANAILGGWGVSTIVRIGSGLPLQFTAPNDLSTYGFPVLRPNITSMGDLTSGQKTPNRWFNTAAVLDPAPYTIGSAPRWFGAVRTAGNRQADISLSKSWQIFEKTRFQFRVEGYNVTNTPQYGRADTGLGDGGFGRVTSTTNIGPRNLQLGARLDF
jgi:hypothetical protein